MNVREQRSEQRMVYYTIVACTFFFYLFNYIFVSPRVSKYFFEKYQYLSYFQQRDWNTRWISMINSVITSSLCFYILLFDEEAKAEDIWAHSTLANTNIALLTGYIMCDLVIVLMYFPLAESKYYIMHHLAAVFAYIYSLTFSGLVYFANFRIMAEVSTPFVNMRWIMSTLQVQKSNKWFVANGLTMVATFFMVRILSMPYYYYKMLTVWQLPVIHTLSYPMKACWLSTCFVLDIINVIWFRKMFNGAKKILKENSQTRINGTIIRKREKGK